MKWFVTQNESVQGPWSVEQVTTWLNAHSNEQDVLIFRRGLTEWLTPNVFLSGNLEDREEKTEKFEEQEILWHYAFEGTSHGPMTRQEMVQQLVRLKNNSSAVLWTRGMKAWVPVYEFSDIMDDVGINRRQFPRIPITGTVKIQFEQKTFEGTANTLSENGFGAVLGMPLEAGTLITFDINSPNLASPLRGRAEVRYVAESLLTGFKFHLLDATTRSTLAELLKQPVRNNSKAAA